VILKLSLPSVGEKTLGKELFAECCICDTRQRALCRVSKKDTRQRNSLPSVKNKTLGKELLRRVFSFTEGFLRDTRQRALCRVPEIKHSAKNMTLGKEPNSGSARHGHTTVGFFLGRIKWDQKQPMALHSLHPLDRDRNYVEGLIQLNCSQLISPVF
jgi:hypothetical protein